MLCQCRVQYWYNVETVSDQYPVFDISVQAPSVVLLFTHYYPFVAGLAFSAINCSEYSFYFFEMHLHQVVHQR